MKNYIVLFLLFLIIKDFSNANAQVTDARVNFLDIKNASLEQTFSHKEKVRVKIENINRFIYKVTEVKTEEDFNVTVPTLLSAIKLPSLLTTKIPAMNAVAKAAVINNGNSTQQLQTDLDDKLKDIIIENRTVNRAINVHNNVVQFSRDCDNTFVQIKTQVESELNQFINANPNAGDNIPVLSIKMETLLTGKIELVNNIVNDMEEILKLWKEKALIGYRASLVIENDNLAKFNRELADLQEKLKTVNAANKPALLVNIDAKEKDIRDLSRKIKQIEEDFESLKKENDVTLEKAKSITADINKYKEDGNFFKLVDDIKKVNESNYTYYSETVELKKDEYTFKISAASEGPLACNKPNEQKVEVALRTKGGVKLDFSTGVFFMPGDKNFLGKSYYYKPISETESTIATPDKGRGLLLGIGALMHIYKRSPSNFKFGGAIGVSSTLNFDVLNFHAGPSFIFGDKERFCFTFGITAREIELLNTDYQLGKVYNPKLLPSAVPTYKMFPKIGGFLAFTYNISRFNK